MTDVRPLASGDPARVGEYELLGRVGEGAQGMVYLARDPGGSHVAVKLLKAHLDGDDTARVRFLQELANAKRVARFCTAQVIAADLEGSRPYIVSEYVEGRSLAQTVNADGPLSGGALERLAIGTATALVAIHKVHVIHRDFKPHNVLLGPDGPRVIDFGIAKALDATSTVSSAVVGTPAYMAPEQVAGAALGPAVDVFAWASTMVFAATGTPPFGQDSIPAVIGRLLHGTPEFGDLGGPVRELVEAAMVRDPAQRPSAQEILLRLLGQDIPSTPISTAPQELLEEGVTRVGAMQPVPAFEQPVEQPVGYPTQQPASESMLATVPAAGGMAMPAASTNPGAYAGPYTPPGGFPAGPPGPLGPPPRKKRGPALAIMGTSVAVALILLLGSFVGYKILTSHNTTKHGDTAAGMSTGGPAGGSSTPPGSPSSSTSSSDSPTSTKTSPSGSGGGSATVTVPSVAGKAQAYAISLLENKGLRYTIVERSSSSYDPGVVMESYPSGGSSVTAGSLVKLYVAKAKPSCTVPDLTGMSSSGAHSALSNAGLTGSASGGTGSSDDRVVSQDPAAGSTCSPGDTVTYTLEGTATSPSPYAS